VTEGYASGSPFSIDHEWERRARIAFDHFCDTVVLDGRAVYLVYVPEPVSINVRRSAPSELETFKVETVRITFSVYSDPLSGKRFGSLCGTFRGKFLGRRWVTP
jgi:hypothetical protein